MMWWLFMLITAAQAETNWEERVTALESRISDLEVGEGLRVVEFGGEFDLTYEHINDRQRAQSKAHRMRFSLDVNAPLTDKVKVYTRLTMDKYFNGFQESSEESTQNSFQESATPYFQRAYLEAELAEGLIFSGGRLPTVEGPPVNYWRNLPRTGTYPSRIYNNIFDGYALTKIWKQDVGQWSGRFLYTPNSLLSPGTSSRPSSTFTGVRTTDIYGVTIERLLADWEISLTYLAINSVDIPLPASIAQSNGKLSWEFTGLSFERKGLLDKRLDVHLSVVQSAVNTREAIILNDGTSTGLLKDGTGTVRAFSYLLTSKTTVAETDGRPWIVGYEFVWTERNYQSPAGTYNYLDPTRFHSTPGYGSHLWLIRPLAEPVLIRGGARVQNIKYANGLFGPQQKVSTHAESFYVALDVFF